MAWFYLGPEGTFSQSAAQSFAGQAQVKEELVPLATIRAAVDQAMDTGSFAVVPYHNLIDGLVQASLDAVLGAGARIYAAAQHPIRITAAEAPGAAADAPVFSHAKALAQCANWLDQHAPGRDRVAVASTAAGVEHALEQRALALASPELIARKDLNVLEPDATNRYFGRVNYTEFLLVGPPGLEPPIRSWGYRCVLACAPQSDRPGLLADILNLFAMFRFNLARLHSRPAINAAPTTLDPQVFFVEIDGAPSDNELKLCAQTLQNTLGGTERQTVLYVLGRYPLLPLDA